MSPEEMKNKVRRLSDEVWNKQNYSILDEMLDPSFIDHSNDLPAPGIQGFKMFAQGMHTAIPDTHWTTEEVLVEGNKAVERWSATGTNTGSLMGMPPTGKSASVTGINIFRWDNNGKIVETWGNWDQLGMMQQFGIIPMPQTANKP